MGEVVIWVTDIAAGDNHSFYIKSDGSLWAMGLNTSGQLGDETTDNRNSPVAVKVSGVAVTGVAQIAAGFNHSLILKSDGSLLAMGLNASGSW